MNKEEMRTRRNTVANLFAILSEKSPYYALGYLESLLSQFAVSNDECYEKIVETVDWIELQE